MGNEKAIACCSSALFHVGLLAALGSGAFQLQELSLQRGGVVLQCTLMSHTPDELDGLPPIFLERKHDDEEVERTDREAVTQPAEPDHLLPADRVCSASERAELRREPGRPVEANTFTRSAAVAPPRPARMPSSVLATEVISVALSLDAVVEGASVDELPRKLASNPAPRYPPDAFRNRLEGRVVLVVRIDESGTVSGIDILKSSGVKSLDQSALETVKQWRFLPARRAGVPIAAVVKVPIRFSIRAG